MVGYPESLTDPSYAGQILVLTFPIVGNYGVPSREEVDAYLNNLPKYFESSKIHVTGLVVAQYTDEYSHYLATSSLAEWLKEQGIAAIYGVDTRAIVQKIRDTGVLLGKLLLPKTGAKAAVNGIRSVNGDVSPLDHFADVEWHDPNTRNLVAEVSLKEPVLYKPIPEKAMKVNGKTLRVLCVDVGMTNNQIRCFVDRGAEVKVVPWDYDFLAVSFS
jgi:carbamoyl-phosphate synthase/aspartate carbamoyltransferase